MVWTVYIYSEMLVRKPKCVGRCMVEIVTTVNICQEAEFCPYL